MKKLVAVILLVCVAFSLSLACAKQQEVPERSITYEDFAARFSYLASKWDVDWDMEKYTIVQNNGNVIVLDIDGVTVNVELDKNDALNIVRASVALGTHTEYNMFMKAIVLVGILEYDLPKTSSQLKTLLNNLNTAFNKAMDTLQISMIGLASGSEDRIAVMLDMANHYYWRIDSDGLSFEVDIVK